LRTSTQVADRVEALARDLDALYSESDLEAARLLRHSEPLGDLPPLLQFLMFAEHHALERGIDYPSMTIGEYVTFAGGYHLVPAMVLIVEKSSVLGAVVRPCGEDPDASVAEVFCIEHRAPGHTTIVPVEQIEQPGDPRLGPQLSEWTQLMVRIQRGMHSRGFLGVQLRGSGDETAMHQHRIADNKLFDAEVRADHFAAPPDFERSN
jgi:hypothetical protein